MTRDDRSRPRSANSSTLRAALDYLARGWSVLPIEPRGKRPLVPWLALQTRHADEAEIRAWFERHPDANVGIVTGAISGMVVVDIDPRHGGAASLADLELEHGALPVTAEVITGGGGRHLYYAHPGGTVPNKVGLRSGIDVRGDGGCVVTPPSLHPSGRRYRWAAARNPDRVALAPLPAWLRAALLQPPPRGTHPVQHWRELVQQRVAPGARNNTLASLAGHLLHRGIDPEVCVTLLLAWNRQHCRPPLADDEVAGIVASIQRTAQRARDAD
jgi:hypothetical protein